MSFRILTGSGNGEIYTNLVFMDGGVVGAMRNGEIVSYYSPQHWKKIVVVK